MTFDEIADFILSKESADGSGDYQPESPSDPETKWGITPIDRPGKPIREITKHDAIQIIRQKYWAKIRGDDLPWQVGLAVLDCIFVGGDGVRFLQRAVGVEADGRIGPVTLRAVGAAMNAEKLAYAVCSMRAVHFMRVAAGNPLKVKFLGGWANRLVAVMDKIEEG
jgi:lysozyme family protein